MLKLRIILISTIITLITTLANHSLAIETKADYAIVLDYETGDTLFQKEADAKVTPSSMTKLMTVYIIFEHLKKNILSLEDTFPVSENAWRKGGSRMFLEHKSNVSIENLLKGITVQSGNDACITIAEGIAGSEEAFAKIMNEKALEIGLKNSHFKNATGWPDEGHYMSVHDIAILSKALIENFPEYYKYFSINSFTYNNIKQNNRNLLLSKDIGIDGLKTGHTEAAGYGMVISGIGKDERRQIVVVNGLKSENERANEAESLFNYGQRYFKKKKKYSKNEVIEKAKVSFGQSELVDVTIPDDIFIIAPKLKADEITSNISYTHSLEAPISKGEQLGVLTISIPKIGDKSFPVIAGNSIEELGWVSRKLEELKQKFDF